MSQTQITADGRQDTADRDCRIKTTFQQNMRSHGSCCGFSVGSGYCDGYLVIFHDLSQQIGTGHHRNIFFFCAGIFRVIRMDRSSVNHQIDTVNNIGCALSVENLCTVRSQMIRQSTFFGIRAGYGESLF